MKSIFSVIAVLAVLLSDSAVLAGLKERQRNRAVKRLSEAIKNTELKDTTREKLEGGKRLNRKERREVKTVERNVYLAKRASGQDEVGH